jgi:hypothetical protein
MIIDINKSSIVYAVHDSYVKDCSRRIWTHMITAAQLIPRIKNGDARK